MKRFIMKIHKTMMLVLSIIIHIYAKKSQRNFNRKFSVVQFRPFMSFSDEYVSQPYKSWRNLLPIIRKVHSEFDVITIPLAQHLEQMLTVPMAVALYNADQNKKAAHRPMQIWLVVFREHFLEKHLAPRRAQDLKGLADHANSIFPGTVSMILLHYGKLTSASNEPAEMEILNITQIWKEGGYKVGVSLVADVCLKKKVSLNWATLLDKIDLINLIRLPDQNLFRIPRKSQVDSFLNEFEKCRNLFTQAIQSRPVSISVETRWPDTSPTGLTSYGNQVHFWKKITEWGAQTKTFVVMQEAFDIPYHYDQSDLSAETCGWWRLAENASYNSTADYVFLEKVKLIPENEEDNPTNSIDNHTLINPTLEISFPPEYFGIAFSPVRTVAALFRNQFPNSSQIALQVEVVSKRFSRLCLTQPLSDHWYERMFSIATSVARHNLLNKEATLESMVSFFGESMDEVIRRFGEAIHIAREANNIFPNTVTTLLMVVQGPQIPLREFHSISKIISGPCEAENIHLGIIIPLQVCNGPVDQEPFDNHITAFLKESVISFIWLQMPVDFQRMKLGVHRMFSRLSVSAEMCRDKINSVVTRMNRTVVVAVGSSWPDSDETKKQNFAQLINYWETWSEWATKHQFMVILGEAFDNEWAKKEDWSHNGWFTLVPGKNDSISDYKFQEKKTIELENRKKKNLKVRNTQVGFSTSLLATGGLLAVACTVVVTAIVWIVRRRATDAMTSLELDEFFKGRGSDQIGIEDGSYDRARWELDRNAFVIDESSELGSGEFGVVCRGTMTKMPGKCGADCHLNVAVKMTKNSGSSTIGLKGLLSEIKVLSYVGHHKNIVSLLGAFTARLRRGQVYVVLELCEHGSLLKYIRQRNPNYLENGNVRSEISESLEIQLLERWTLDIVTGMEFLASKKVVHADLATRNVLLMADQTAKISDFGLSRRLHNYSLYVKAGQEPLPWRWMAPESLTKLEFTEKTDVWAFGVTLWEMYSLGEVPFSGLSLQASFTSKLADGTLRLEKPVQSSDNVFSVMTRCWSVNPSNRPTFAELKIQLEAPS